MAHSVQALPISGSASVAVQKFGGSDERQEVTQPIPEAATRLSLSVTTSDAQILAADATRTTVFLQNPSSNSATAWLALGSDTAAASGGIHLPPGGYIELRWQGAVRAIGTAAHTLTGYAFTTT